jgi:hypothetical protein
LSPAWAALGPHAYRRRHAHWPLRARPPGRKAPRRPRTVVAHPAQERQARGRCGTSRCSPLRAHRASASDGALHAGPACLVAQRPSAAVAARPHPGPGRQRPLLTNVRPGSVAASGPARSSTEPSKLWQPTGTRPVPVVQVARRSDLVPLPPPEVGRDGRVRTDGATAAGWTGGHRAAGHKTAGPPDPDGGTAEWTPHGGCGPATTPDRWTPAGRPGQLTCGAFLDERPVRRALNDSSRRLNALRSTRAATTRRARAERYRGTSDGTAHGGTDAPHDPVPADLAGGSAVGWPVTDQVNAFTASLVVYPVIAAGLLLYRAGRVGPGFWALVSGGLLIQGGPTPATLAANTPTATATPTPASVRAGAAVRNGAEPPWCRHPDLPQDPARTRRSPASAVGGGLRYRRRRTGLPPGDDVRPPGEPPNTATSRRGLPAPAATIRPRQAPTRRDRCTDDSPGRGHRGTPDRSHP